MTHFVQHALRAAGIGAPIAFVLRYAALTIALVPGTAPSVLAGALFGCVGPRDYVAATAVGILPATFAFVALGSSLGDPSSPGFAAALAVTPTLAVAVPLLERVLGRRRSHRTATR